MRVSAVLTQVRGRWFAECGEVDRTGEGATAEEAVASLRAALVEYFGEAQAVAPPSRPALEALEIVIVDAPTNAPDGVTR